MVATWCCKTLTYCHCLSQPNHCVAIVPKLHGLALLQHQVTSHEHSDSVVCPILVISFKRTYRCHNICRPELSSIFTPLLTVQLAEVVPSVAEVLLAHGAEVNKVAKGQSPLSLAIINGHDSVSVLWSPHSIHSCMLHCKDYLVKKTTTNNYCSSRVR